MTQSAKIKIAIVGASGYTGLELARLLATHPQADVVAVTSEQNPGVAYDRFFPGLRGFVSPHLTLSAIGQKDQQGKWPGLDSLLKKAEVFFTALPHGTSTECVNYLYEKGARIIDLSADFRLKNLEVYEAWYGQHTAAHLVPEAVYGIPEFHRADMKKTRIIANPGCYPTSAIFALAPLLKHELIDTKTIVIDSKSGTSGAGRTAKQNILFSEISEGIRAYGVAHHRHTPEIEQELSSLAGHDIRVTFTPHLVPMHRGILTVAYGQLKDLKTDAQILELYRAFYKNECYVRVTDELPDSRNVRGSYFVDLSVRIDARTQRVIAISTIDNLNRGASGQAIAGFNLMMGFDEGLGLNHPPLLP